MSQASGTEEQIVLAEVTQIMESGMPNLLVKVKALDKLFTNRFNIDEKVYKDLVSKILKLGD